MGEGRSSEATASDRVSIHEVGPRDGLQNEAALLTVEARLRLIPWQLQRIVNELAATGLTSLLAVSEEDWAASLPAPRLKKRLGALAFRINDRPEMPTVCLTPGTSRATCSIWAMTFWVRSMEAESGSWTLRIR